MKGQNWNHEFKASEERLKVYEFWSELIAFGSNGNDEYIESWIRLMEMHTDSDNRTTANKNANMKPIEVGSAKFRNVNSKKIKFYKMPMLL